MKRTSATDSIMVHDPSITAWGWAVLDWDDQVLDAGCIKTSSEHKKRRIRKGDDTIRRISEINRRLLEVIHRYHTIYMVSELPHGSQSASAALMMGITSAVPQALGDALNIPVEWYSEGDAKKALLNKRSAAKQEIIDAIGELYQVDWTGVKYRDEAIADALAIHYVAQLNSQAIKMMKLKS